MEIKDQLLQLTAEMQKKMVDRAFWGSIIAALIGALGGIIGALIGIIPRLPVPEQIYMVEVSAVEYPFVSTNIPIKIGDDVQIIVQNPDPHWNCGKGETSPEGVFDDRWEKHVVPSANQCELVGYIQEGDYFRIGAYEQFTAEYSGSLYLGANDAHAYDYFQDNTGTLVVKVIIKKVDK